MTREDIQSVLDLIPHLDARGVIEPRKEMETGNELQVIVEQAGHAKFKKELLESSEACTRVSEWLEDVKPTKTFGSQLNSYELKHVAEEDIGYVTNGAFIAAAIHAGFPYCVNPPNVTFAMARASITAIKLRQKSGMPRRFGAVSILMKGKRIKETAALLMRPGHNVPPPAIRVFRSEQVMMFWGVDPHQAMADSAESIGVELLSRVGDLLAAENCRDVTLLAGPHGHFNGNQVAAMATAGVLVTEHEGSRANTQPTASAYKPPPQASPQPVCYRIESIFSAMVFGDLRRRYPAANAKKPAVLLKCPICSSGDVGVDVCPVIEYDNSPMVIPMLCLGQGCRFELCIQKEHSCSNKNQGSYLFVRTRQP